MMTSLLESLVVGLSISCIVLAGWWLSRRFFIWSEARKPLTPNCLLTKYPILIVSEQSSPWKFWSPEEKAKQFLYNHGYTALVVTRAEYSQFVLKQYDNQQFHAVQSSSLSTRVKGLPQMNLKDRPSILKQVIEFAEQEFI